MAAAGMPVPVSVYEYLHTVYEPDLDYVDGVLEERNVGEFEHWRIQRAFLEALLPGEQRHGYFVVQETRVQVTGTRFRVPDTCLVSRVSLPRRIITHPPLLCIEVLSPEDRFSRVREKCQDYLRMGVPEVWVIDPELRKAHVLTPDGSMREHGDGPLRCAKREFLSTSKRFSGRLIRRSDVYSVAFATGLHSQRVFGSLCLVSSHFERPCDSAVGVNESPCRA